MFTIAAFTALVSFASTSFAQEGSSSSSVAQLVASLRQAPTEVDRFRILSDDQFLFDFVNPPSTVGVTNGAGGHTVAATSANFPAIIGQGVSMTIGFLGPCGMNSPHTHPRATEINFSVNTTLRGGVLIENGARFAEIDIAPGSATVFPQGAIHFEMNPSCEDAMFVAGFNGEDPGVNQVAQRYFGLPPDIVGATLGGLGVQEVADLEALIPDNVILGVDECLMRCGIERTPQPNAQRQPRVSANAFPANVEATNIFGLVAATGSASAEGPTATASAEGPSTSSTGEGAGESAGVGEGAGAGEGAGQGAGEGEGASSAYSSYAPEPTRSASYSSSSAPEPTRSASSGEGESSGRRRSSVEVRELYPEVMQFALRR